ncbi:hypothetical protein [Candidatus Spyradosoma sp. SGI.093]|uniref:hypothetical protein n=1 Tax=Candidatus Spyradosoma sp. SGI.093 TaxID=3420583 RepID=UPI003D070559
MGTIVFSGDGSTVTFEGNTASTGDGGAIFATRGVSFSGAGAQTVGGALTLGGALALGDVKMGAAKSLRRAT